VPVLVVLLLEDVAMHIAALLGSSLLSLQSCALVEDDTGRHDRLPPCRFQASVVKFVSTASHS